MTAHAGLPAVDGKVAVAEQGAAKLFKRVERRLRRGLGAWRGGKQDGSERDPHKPGGETGSSLS